jgi:hypothetical protein
MRTTGKAATAAAATTAGFGLAVAQIRRSRARAPEPSGAAAVPARLAGHDPRQAVRSALRESKSLIEVGEVLRVDPRGRGGVR